MCDGSTRTGGRKWRGGGCGSTESSENLPRHRVEWWRTDVKRVRRACTYAFMQTQPMNGNIPNLKAVARESVLFMARRLPRAPARNRLGSVRRDFLPPEGRVQRLESIWRKILRAGYSRDKFFFL